MKEVDKERLRNSILAASEMKKKARQKKSQTERKLEDIEEDPENPSYALTGGTPPLGFIPPPSLVYKRTAARDRDKDGTLADKTPRVRKRTTEKAKGTEHDLQAAMRQMFGQRFFTDYQLMKAHNMNFDVLREKILGVNTNVP
ncbi:hypothetical protein J6590_105636 [Homalodisca vitripennis]|nr:hypothetical protein J6590_105636 [Homalodisca vitripennis]